MITATMLIKWAAAILFGTVAVVDILLVLACSELERRRRQKRRDL